MAAGLGHDHHGLLRFDRTLGNGNALLRRNAYDVEIRDYHCCEAVEIPTHFVPPRMCFVLMQARLIPQSVARS